MLAIIIPLEGGFGSLPHPEHPIYYPPTGSQPPVFPTHPIVLPPETPIPPDVEIWPKPPDGVPPSVPPDKQLVWVYVPGVGGCWMLTDVPPPVAGPK